jgi:ribosomal protein S1
MSGDIDDPKNAPALVVGQVHRGPVTSVKRFGVFVAVGDIEGLVDAWRLHESRQAWPALGETVTVCIETVREDGKVSLSLVD